MSTYIVRLEIVELFDNGAERVLGRVASDEYHGDDDSVAAVEDLFDAAWEAIS